jgi:hypothetical protein
MTDRGERRRLVVTGCRQVASGRGEHGEWRLHEIEATTVDGKPIRARLVSFDAFEAGEVDVLVERQDHPEHGTSYLLRRPRAVLAGRVEGLEREVRALADRIGRLEDGR